MSKMNFLCLTQIFTGIPEKVIQDRTGYRSLDGLLGTGRWMVYWVQVVGWST